MSRKQLLLIAGACLIVAGIGTYVYNRWFSSTKILVVNSLPAQEAEIRLNNTNKHIDVTCLPMSEAHGFKNYDAVLMFGRGLFLDSIQMADLREAADAGVKFFTSTLRNFSVDVNYNITEAQSDTLQSYFRNPCRSNYSNLLRYARAISTPQKWGDKSYMPPTLLPNNMFYHLESGKYFEKSSQLTEYLKDRGLYADSNRNVAFISGITFPVEGNRAHVDTLISRLTREGYNVYPLSASGKARAKMIKEISPAAIVYLPMGRLGNDTLINWCYDQKIPLFMPFPLIQPREKWLDPTLPVTAGTLNARIVVPEIDGAMTPLCISTQDAGKDGFMVYNPDPERINAFMEQFTRFMNLKEMRNIDKKVAIGYFKSPGKDALLASGMEVVPSLYNFLKRLRGEGYNVDGLPSTLEEFKKEIMLKGSVMGSYADGAQKKFMDEASPVWLDKTTYEKWAKEILLPEKYKEVTDRYGAAPGNLLSRNDSIAIAAIQYGNILLFPQPRPALGDDEFKLVHGAQVAPPHSYLAPYFYMQKGFNADALIHFGTHGNLEFTPGKNVGLSQADWADVLIGNRPHFYFYTTGNVGEGIIAKRRTHAVLVTYLTPPYVESGMRQKYSSLLENIHRAIADSSNNTVSLKNEIVSLGLHSDLKLDSTTSGTYSMEELELVDNFVEELANEKITGAYYVLGTPYSKENVTTTVEAIVADKIAYQRAKKDYETRKISEVSLHDPNFIRHKYLSGARQKVRDVCSSKTNNDAESEMINEFCRLLMSSPDSEIEAMLSVLSGEPVRPAPGGDPVLNPNVLPTGRNMFSINAEATPGVKAWNDGVSLAEQTLSDYLKKHGEYPKKVSYTFWSGEFISSQGATLAQAFRMLGVEPVRDDQGRVMDLKLTPSKELGRPRINVMVQVSGQLRDIAASRLQMITDAVKLASESTDDIYPNYVREGSVDQEKILVDNGVSPKDARELSAMRVFGPVNSGYSTGMLAYTENSGSWDDRNEIVEGFVNNMCALYGDTLHWGKADPSVFKAAVTNTDVIVQPRQSNTWGPISLDHVYEFTGGLSLVASSINGKEPDAVMADYRNPYLPKLQDANQAVAVEVRSSLLNPVFISERMKGDATTAQMFGEMFRNVFGWNVMRQSVLNENIYDDLYDIYIEDCYDLGIKEYFDKTNLAAFQEMTATMLESARKGYWKASDAQLKNVAKLHAETTEKFGAPCTEFVCGNQKLQEYVANALPEDKASSYKKDISEALSAGGDGIVMKKDSLTTMLDAQNRYIGWVIPAIIIAVMIIVMVTIIRSRKNKK